MKHLTYYAPEKIVMPAYKRAEYLSGAGRKNATIFHNIIFINASYLSIEEFIKSFNDIDKPDYLNPDYKDKIVQAYWENQREFPNEDLMCFNQDIYYFEKALAAKYTKNEEMLTLFSQDNDFMIREILASRKDLPKHIVDKLITDPATSVRMFIIASDCPLSKEQVKLFAKDCNRDVVLALFANQKIKIDDEIIDYFVKYGSLEIKKRVVEGYRHSLTNEQIEYLLLPANNNIEIKCLLAMLYDLSEKTLLDLLKINQIQLLRQIAYRKDLTLPMVMMLIAKNNDSLNLDLVSNKSLLRNYPQMYQDLVSKVLQDSSYNITKQALQYYIRNLINNFKLPNNVLVHLTELNYKNTDCELANLILQIPNIPQYMVERVAFDSAINYLFEINYKGSQEYYTVGVSTPYFKLVLKIKDYVQKSGYVQSRPRFC